MGRGMVITAYRRHSRKSVTLPALFLIWGICSRGLQAAGEIGAVGHLEPGSGILDLIGTPGARISEVLVAEGQRIERGEILLKFSNSDILKAQLDLAALELDELEKTKQMQLTLRQHALQSAKMAFGRAERKLLDHKKLGAATSKRALMDLEDYAEDARRLVEKEAMLYQQLEVKLEIEMLKAKAQLDLAKARYDDAFLIAPISGTVLAVLKQVGESLGVGAQVGAGHLRGRAAVRIADLTRMYVVCEVYEGDLLKIRKGMKATVSSNALPEEIGGTVERISREVDTSSRLANVWILLDEADLASRLIGMEVRVNIRP